MYILVAIIAFVVVLLILRRRGGGDRQMISSEDAKKLIGKKGVHLIDVRSPGEYQSGHIKGARNIPVGDIQRGAEGIVPNKEDKIIVYCQSGSRSMIAYHMIMRAGYVNVYDLGGIGNWPYEIER